MIPYELAYGGEERGEITPFATLIFDIDLLEIENQENDSENSEEPEIEIEGFTDEEE